MEGRIHNQHIILSRVKGSIEDLPESTRKEIDALPQKPQAVIPYDDALVDLDLAGEPLIKISPDAVSFAAVKNMLKGLGILN